jgi:hypothetical protein
MISEVNYCAYIDENVTVGVCENETIYVEEETPDIKGRGDLFARNLIFSDIDRFYPYGMMQFSIYLGNNGGSKIKDLKISILIYDLGVYYSFDRFDLKPKERVTKRMGFDVSNLPKGFYDVRVVVSNGYIKRVFYRRIRIL